MAYKVTGRVLEAESGWGVPNVAVEFWDKDDRTADDRLGSTITLPDGSFALLFREEDFQEGFLDRKPDLYLRVLKPDGSLIYSTEDNIREEAGRRESFILQIPREKLGDMAPKRGVELHEVAQGVDLLSIEEEEFVEEAIGQERTARRRALLATTAAILVVLALVTWRFVWNSQSRIATRIGDKWGPSIVLIQTDETGSGIIFDKKGHILTNYHVVDGGAPYNVRLSSGRTVEAELVGYDIGTDLAVLKVDVPANELVVAPTGDASSIKVGDLSIAIGNPLGLERTLTVGHVSALNRSLETADPFGAVIDGVIQTDASINPGNSGGGLFNAKGEIVGINTQIVTVGGGSVGLGFAVPINLAKRIAEELIANGVVARPFLGVKALKAPSGEGVRINFIAGRSPAKEAGFQLDDIILSIGSHPVRFPADLPRYIEQFEVGDTVDVTIERDGQQMVIPVALQAAPWPGRSVRLVQVTSPPDSNDPTQEWIEIENQGYRTVNLRDYTLQSPDGKAYPLPDFSLPPLRRVRIYTGPGTDDDGAIYLNASTRVWGNTTSIVLLDANGNQADAFSR